MPGSVNRIPCPKCGWEHLPKVGALHDGVYQGKCQQCATTFTFKSTNLPRSEVNLSINGVSYNVSEVDANMTLVEFIREKVGLWGVKTMCEEGGCGVCIVAASYFDHVKNKKRTFSINSCLIPVYACSGMEIWTSVGLGNKKDGFHVLQQRLAEHNGSQCGYCSPGFVMSMYSYLQDNPGITEEEVEESFAGNLCRCTGYRAILSAMRTFAVDGDAPLTDIEDLKPRGCCKQNGAAAVAGRKCTSSSSCRDGDGGMRAGVVDPIHVTLVDADWNIPTSLSELYSLLRSSAGKKVRLVHGNTSSGVYKNEGPYDVYIDIKQVKDLYTHTTSSQSVTIGSNVSINNLIDIVHDASGISGFSYFKQLEAHLRKGAMLSVRNLGSWAGNIMMKYHHGFPGDLFPAFEAAGAKVKIGSVDGSTTEVTPLNLLKVDMNQRVLLSITFYPMAADEYYMPFKVMPRAQASHAHVVGAFWFKMDKTRDYVLKATPRMVYAGISSTFNHATMTETYLRGKQLTNQHYFTGALQTLHAEILPDYDPAVASVTYRRELAVAMFYRFVVQSCSDKVADKFKSGGFPLERPLSSGQQNYSTDPRQYPLTEPMPKVSSQMQASGEADYIDTMPPPPGTLYAKFVLSTIGNGQIASIDAKEALAMPGVVRFIQAKDIPSGGVNSFVPPPSAVEEIVTSGDIGYAGQAVGIIVADSQRVANDAATKVKVSYKNVQKPILTVQDAINYDSFYPKPCPDWVIGNAESAVNSSAFKVEGQVTMGPQYHFHLENQACRCVPCDDGFEVYSSTQWPDGIQTIISRTLDIPENSIHVQTKRVGGGFGAKYSRAGQVAAASALASHLTNRPVHMILSLQDNIEMCGKRFPYIGKYKVGVNRDGKLNGVIITYYADHGASPNDSVVTLVNIFADNGYKCDNWHLIPMAVKTNTPGNSWCRAPMSTEDICIMETVMDHIAETIGRDPLEVRKVNLYNKGDVTLNGDVLTYCNIRELVTQIETDADITRRKQQVKLFNQANRWKKKGLGVLPLKYPVNWQGNMFNTMVTIYHGDGTVLVSHGGIEMGQGIHTKIAQVCAYELGIPVSQVRVSGTESIATSNSTTTGFSTTTELNAIGVIDCCTKLMERINPVKAQMRGASWKEVIGECYSQGMDLSQRSWTVPKTKTMSQYRVYGVTCAEAEVDILTGETVINRVDMLYDCGQSMNPSIDIGQMEGGFVFGMGYFMTEEIRYDPATGQNMSASTWKYKPPGAKDIPVDFRINTLKDAPNPLGVLGSKAVGEPPMVMSCSVLLAIKDAITAARNDAGIRMHFELGPPATTEMTQLNCMTNITHYVLQ